MLCPEQLHLSSYLVKHRNTSLQDYVSTMFMLSSLSKIVATSAFKICSTVTFRWRPVCKTADHFKYLYFCGLSDAPNILIICSEVLTFNRAVWYLRFGCKHTCKGGNIHRILSKMLSRRESKEQTSKCLLKMCLSYAMPLRRGGEAKVSVKLYHFRVFLYLAYMKEMFGHMGLQWIEW